MLSGTLAQQIAGETTEAIGYNVIITDAEGMVIGSGDTSRVGSFHEASIEVMRTRESAWHNPEEARALRGVRPGITLPLVIGDEAVGTVGITGSPRQVRRFGLVVRRQTEILLEESALVRSRLMRERALEDLVNEVAAFDPELVESSSGKLQVILLGSAPKPAAAKQLLAMATEDDRLALEGAELHWLPSGGLMDSGLDLDAVAELAGPTTVRTKGTMEQIAAKFFA